MRRTWAAKVSQWVSFHICKSLVQVSFDQIHVSFIRFLCVNIKGLLCIYVSNLSSKSESLSIYSRLFYRPLYIYIYVAFINLLCIHVRLFCHTCHTFKSDSVGLVHVYIRDMYTYMYKKSYIFCCGGMTHMGIYIAYIYTDPYMTHMGIYIRIYIAIRVIPPQQKWVSGSLSIFIRLFYRSLYLSPVHIYASLLPPVSYLSTKSDSVGLVSFTSLSLYVFLDRYTLLWG